jgi:hypothetical protein
MAFRQVEMHKQMDGASREKHLLIKRKGTLLKN